MAKKSKPVDTFDMMIYARQAGFYNKYVDALDGVSLRPR